MFKELSLYQSKWKYGRLFNATLFYTSGGVKAVDCNTKTNLSFESLSFSTM